MADSFLNLIKNEGQRKMITSRKVKGTFASFPFFKIAIDSEKFPHWRLGANEMLPLETVSRVMGVNNIVSLDGILSSLIVLAKKKQIRPIRQWKHFCVFYH